VDIAARLETVEKENETLRDRIAQLEALVFEETRLPVELKLTGQQERLVHFLFKRNEASKDAILSAVYGARPDADEPEIKIIDVFICQARRKLAPFDIKIETIWGRGYFMPPASKVRLRALQANSNVGAPS
jgi:DNA-binding response OmpR family regulator